MLHTGPVIAHRPDPRRDEALIAAYPIAAALGRSDALEQIREVLLHTMVYCGVPAALALATACGPGPRTPDVSRGRPLVHPEHYAHSIAALGFPGARRAFQIGGEGGVGPGRDRHRGAIDGLVGEHAVGVRPVY